MKRYIRLIIILNFFTSVVSAAAAEAETTVTLNFQNQELSKVIETYAKASGQKFVIDEHFAGKATIYLPGPVSLPEAFNQISSALALNGYGISHQGDTMIIQSARNIERNLIDVGADLPPLAPQRMFTWVFKAQNVPVDKINRDVRILTSKDGEMSTFPDTNQIVFTDWVSNLYRIREILKNIDVKPDAATAKIAAEALRSETLARAKEKNSQKSGTN